MDVEDIQPGQNFAEAIDRTIASCSAVLVIIGPRWMETLQKRSESKQEDYVPHEIEAALTRKILTIPVLVGGASTSQFTGLPPALNELRLHEAFEIRDSTFRDDCARLAKAVGAPEAAVPRRNLVGWIAGGGALVALLIALSMWIGIGPGSEHRQRKVRIERILNTARVQTEQGEYESAFRTYREALKLDPDSPTILDRQLDAAMRWAENFSVLAAENQKSEDLAAPLVRQLISTLEAGLARTNQRGPRAADILAHLGWAHWLNRHIAFQEFGSAAEQALRKALSLDPSNVYANAMLGNWLLQTHGSVEEAMRHFDVAVKSGKERPLVRSMQLGGMIYDSDPGVRTELMRVVNQMRMNSETIADSEKAGILSNYSPTVNSPEKLRKTLAAVPPDQAWATFLWLDNQQENRYQHALIQAIIAEFAGRNSESLAMFNSLQHDLKVEGSHARVTQHVDAAIKRLSQATQPENKR